MHFLLEFELNKRYVLLFFKDTMNLKKFNTLKHFTSPENILFLKWYNRYKLPSSKDINKYNRIIGQLKQSIRKFEESL